MNNDFREFLARIPWADRNLLENYFGIDFTEKLLSENQDDIASIHFADGHTYFSLKPANFHLITGIPRREMARKYIAEIFGYLIFDHAESPCRNADLRAYHEAGNTWIRVWGDMGHITPDALLIFRNPPVFANSLRDIILTNQGPERTSLLKAFAEKYWKNAQKDSVEIIELSGNKTRIVRPAFEFCMDLPDYSPKSEIYPKFSTVQVPACNDTGKRRISIQEHRNNALSGISASAAPEDYALLRFIACNPFLRKEEIAVLFGGDSCSAYRYSRCEKEYRRIMEVIEKVELLHGKRLLKYISKGPMSGTYIPDWQGIDLLAAYHGTIPAYLKKYSQWPLEAFREKDFDDYRPLLDNSYKFFDSHCFYRYRWGTVRPEHQILCRQFGAALILGARSLKSIYGTRIEADGITTIPSSLKITAVSRGKKIIRLLRPDGSCTISAVSRNRTRKWKVFFEIERNTNDKKVLMEKLSKYRKFIPAARLFYKGYEDVILIFFFDDSDCDSYTVHAKCRMILETMKKYGIRGCTGLLSDARRVPDGWKPKHGITEEKACGFMYLYRNMWLTTDSLPQLKKRVMPGIFTG